MHETALRVVMIALSIVIISSSRAQDGVVPRPGLAELERQFTEDMREAMAPAGVPYLAELKKLERQFALAGKFEEAIATRDEATAISRFLGAALDQAIAAKEEAEAGTGPLGPPESGVTKLANTAADISSGARFTPDGLSLDTGGATATWKLDPTHQPGGYEVVISYSSKENTDVQMRESFFRLSGELPATGGEKASMSLGSLKITSRSDRVSLINTGGDDSGSSQLIIHSVQLISAKD